MGACRSWRVRAAAATGCFNCSWSVAMDLGSDDRALLSRVDWIGCRRRAVRNERRSLSRENGRGVMLETACRGAAIIRTNRVIDCRFFANPRQGSKRPGKCY